MFREDDTVFQHSTRGVADWLRKGGWPHDIEVGELSRLHARLHNFALAEERPVGGPAADRGEPPYFCGKGYETLPYRAGSRAAGHCRRSGPDEGQHLR